MNAVAAVPAGTVPNIANSYAMYELGMMQLRAAKRDAGAVTLWAPGAQAPNAQQVSFAGTAATLDYFGDPVAIRTDAAGRILGADGTKTTNKVLVERVASADIAAIARGLGPLGVASPRDTARIATAGAQLWIDYGRPSVRGRSVWGGELVPFGTVWRTGANAATQLTTSAPITLAGLAVPAGSYTLWTIPHAGGVELIVNRQTGQWGTGYGRAHDLGRARMTSDTLATPVERFTIAIAPSEGRRGALTMAWGPFRWTAPLEVR
jgi:hypothetical protein